VFVRVGLLTTGGSRLAGVDVADDDNVDVSLLLTTDLVSMVMVMMQASASSPWTASQVPGGWVVLTPWWRLCV
jgi:hypothetical protein